MKARALVFHKRCQWESEVWPPSKSSGDHAVRMLTPQWFGLAEIGPWLAATDVGIIRCSGLHPSDTGEPLLWKSSE